MKRLIIFRSSCFAIPLLKAHDEPAPAPALAIIIPLGTLGERGDIFCFTDYAIE